MLPQVLEICSRNGQRVTDFSRKSIFLSAPMLPSSSYQQLNPPQHFSNAIEAIHTLCYQPNPSLLHHPTPYFYKITFSLRFYIFLSWTTAQVFILQTWRWIHLRWSVHHHNEGQMKITNFSFAIVSLSKKNPKISLQENFARDLFIVMWSHLAHSDLPKYSLQCTVHIIKGMVILKIHFIYIYIYVWAHTHSSWCPRCFLAK